MARWLLVHPPLLGPGVLVPLAAELERLGDDVALPDLRAAVDPAAGWPERWRDAAAAHGPADAVLGFSGAGVTLPAVGARRVVWVDALLPARSGVTEADEEIRSRVAGMVVRDRIPDWTTWWGPGALDELLPDERVRAAVRAEGHELPAGFYDVAVPVPAGWPEDGARYVHLSAAYDDAAAGARHRGWPVAGDGRVNHLDVATSPERVAALLR